MYEVVKTNADNRLRLCSAHVGVSPSLAARGMVALLVGVDAMALNVMKAQSRNTCTLRRCHIVFIQRWWRGHRKIYGLGLEFRFRVSVYMR